MAITPEGTTEIEEPISKLGLFQLISEPTNIEPHRGSCQEPLVAGKQDYDMSIFGKIEISLKNSFFYQVDNILKYLGVMFRF